LYFVLLFSPDLSSYQLKKRLFLTLTLKKTNYVSGNQKVVETPLATEFSIDDDECCLDPALQKKCKKLSCFVTLVFVHGISRSVVSRIVARQKQIRSIVSKSLLLAFYQQKGEKIDRKQQR
jgi:hypothetical protein